VAVYKVVEKVGKTFLGKSWGKSKLKAVQHDAHISAAHPKQVRQGLKLAS
jgi:hypothetical protein